MEGLKRVGRTEDFASRKPKNVSLEGLEVVIVRIGGKLFAFENNCPHQHFSLLHEGFVDQCTVTCPMHGWNFELESGNATNGNGKLRKFEVKVTEGWVWIKIDQEEQKYSLFDDN